MHSRTDSDLREGGRERETERKRDRERKERDGTDSSWNDILLAKGIGARVVSRFFQKGGRWIMERHL